MFSPDRNRSLLHSPRAGVGRQQVRSAGVLSPPRSMMLSPGAQARLPSGIPSSPEHLGRSTTQQVSTLRELSERLGKSTSQQAGAVSSGAVPVASGPLAAMTSASAAALAAAAAPALAALASPRSFEPASACSSSEPPAMAAARSYEPPRRSQSPASPAAAHLSSPGHSPKAASAIPQWRDQARGLAAPPLLTVRGGAAVSVAAHAALSQGQGQAPGSSERRLISGGSMSSLASGGSLAAVASSLRQLHPKPGAAQEDGGAAHGAGAGQDCKSPLGSPAQPFQQSPRHSPRINSVPLPTQVATVAAQAPLQRSGLPSQQQQQGGSSSALREVSATPVASARSVGPGARTVSGTLPTAIATSREPTATPWEPTAMPREPTATPREPTATPREPTATPRELTAMTRQGRGSSEELGKVAAEASQHMKEVKHKIESIESYLSGQDRIAAKEAATAQGTLLAQMERGFSQVVSRLHRMEQQSASPDEAAAHAEARIELERKLKSSNDLCNKYKARHADLERQIEQQQAESAELRAQLDAKSSDLRRAEERLGEATRSCSETQAMYKELLEGKCQRLQEGGQGQERGSGARRAKEKQREQDLGKREQELRVREQALASRELRATERVSRDLAQQREEAPELERQQREQRGRHSELEKENRWLQQTTHEQKQMIFDLKNQLHRAETTGKYASPGEFFRMIKKQESETSTHANAVLTLRNSNLSTELKELRWHNELLLKHLPPLAREAVAQEITGRTLPPQEVTES